MLNAALATSAAPLYFPAACVDDHRLNDGGVWANNLSVVAITEAVSMLDVPLRAIMTLNDGTTIDQITIHPKRIDRGGLHVIGKGNYARFDVSVPGELYSLDSADPEDVAGLAAHVSRNLSPTYGELFAGHKATKYTPLIENSQDNDTITTSPTEDSDATR